MSEVHKFISKFERGNVKENNFKLQKWLWTNSMEKFVLVKIVLVQNNFLSFRYFLNSTKQNKKPMLFGK